MRLLIVLAGVLLLAACQKDKPEPVAEQLEFIHIAHTRTGDNAVFLDDLQRINFQQFDLRLLGGDLAAHTSADEATMDSLDRFFDFRNPNTLWTLGNHDYDDLALVETYTERPTFFAHHFKGISFVVLDSQDSLSNITAAQIELIKAVLDTMESSSHLVLLTHKLIWLQDEGELAAQINDIANGEAGSCFYCTNPNNFYQEVYPLLVSARQHGVEIYCIAGDVGFKTKTYYHQTAEGIHFLASGLNGSDPDNQVLLFEYDEETQVLDWVFARLSQIQ